MGIAGITVAGGSTSVPYVDQNHSNPMQGMVRIWGSDLQVFTGSGWQNLSASYATASLDQDVLDTLAWARKARDEEKEFSKLAEENPAVKIALDNMRRAQAQLKATIILSKEHDETTS